MLFFSVSLKRKNLNSFFWSTVTYLICSISTMWHISCKIKCEKHFIFFLNCNFVWVNCSHWIKLQYHEDTEKRKVSCYILSLINYYSVLKTEKSGWRYGSAVNRAYYFYRIPMLGCLLLVKSSRNLTRFSDLSQTLLYVYKCTSTHINTH